MWAERCVALLRSFIHFHYFPAPPESPLTEPLQVGGGGGLLVVGGGSVINLFSPKHIFPVRLGDSPITDLISDLCRRSVASCVSWIAFSIKLLINMFCPHFEPHFYEEAVKIHSPLFADRIDSAAVHDALNWCICLIVGLIVSDDCWFNGCCSAPPQRWGFEPRLQSQRVLPLAQILKRTKGGNNRLISLHCFSAGKQRRQAVLPAEEDIEKTIPKSRQPNPLQGL